jgi:CBS domain-containing protein
MRMNVDHILQNKGRAVTTIEPQRSLLEAAKLLLDKRIGAVVVADSTRPVIGIISERDIVRAVAAEGASALGAPVSRFMTQEVVTCTGRSAINDIMEMMTTGKFRHVPVVENGHLVGIISIGDVVKHRLAEIEAETRAMRDYIATA